MKKIYITTFVILCLAFFATAQINLRVVWKLQTTNFPDGVYLLNVKTAEGSTTKKLIVKH